MKYQLLKVKKKKLCGWHTKYCAILASEGLVFAWQADWGKGVCVHPLAYKKNIRLYSRCAKCSALCDSTNILIILDLWDKTPVIDLLSFIRAMSSPALPNTKPSWTMTLATATSYLKKCLCYPLPSTPLVHLATSLVALLLFIPGSTEREEAGQICSVFELNTQWAAVRAKLLPIWNKAKQIPYSEGDTHQGGTALAVDVGRRIVSVAFHISLLQQGNNPRKGLNLDKLRKLSFKLYIPVPFPLQISFQFLWLVHTCRQCSLKRTPGTWWPQTLL